MIKVISLLFISYLILNMTNRYFKMHDLEKFKVDQLKKIEELKDLKRQSNWHVPCDMDFGQRRWGA